jgi:hypothetical protein
VARLFRLGLAISGPFGCRCLSIPTMPRFHIPLIKPDMQISRIRLTPVSSSLRIRQVTARDPDVVQTKDLVEMLGREPF